MQNMAFHNDGVNKLMGLDLFKERFANFKNEYVIIGGTACDLLLENAGLSFRATKDLDIVLIIEALSNEFCSELWSFINDGEYEVYRGKDDVKQFFRFSNPKNLNYPSMIELLSRPNTDVDLFFGSKYISLSTEDDLFSLSAILLNDSYYSFLRNGIERIDGVQVLSPAYLIPLKMKAWLDNKSRREEGIKVNSRDIKKHKNDVFRLSRIVAETDLISVPLEVHSDIQLFVSMMREESLNLDDLQVYASKEDILNIFDKIYVLEN